MIAPDAYDNMTRWLADCRRPLLIAHRSPDGDALGALAALSMFLERRGAQPQVVLYEPFPARYALLRDFAAWQVWEPDPGPPASDGDAVIVVDTCSRSQLEPARAFLDAAPRMLVVDHHATHDDLGTRPGDLRLLDPSASAVCVLIAEWAWSAGVPLDREPATALFVGVATDCGWFRYSNTDARTLRVAAGLLEAGLAVRELYAALYEQETPARLRLLGRMFQSLEMHADDRLAVMSLRRQDFLAAGADPNETDELVNEAGRLGCADATILFTEQTDHIRVNFRSKRRLDVAALARRFGGGGHTRAAGARLRGSWAEVVPQVIAAACAALDETAPESTAGT